MPEHALNQTQQEAIHYHGGPLLIVAGAGTGKTTVIAEKIAYLIREKLAKPEEILALTFTDKAAAEMESRVDACIDIGYTDIRISTFHTFGQRLLEQHGLAIGIPNQSKLLTETEAWLLMRAYLDQFHLTYYRPLGNPAKHIHALRQHFSTCKDELISPLEYMQYAETVALDADGLGDTERNRWSELANAYHTYNQLLLNHGARDFADLLYYSVKLLRDRPRIRETLQRRFKYILVDEFQDVNTAQYELVKLLAGPLSQLTVVGDDDQSIYAFRGASVANILRFRDDYPQAKIVVLQTNYRSNQVILDTAYQSIQHNNPDRLEEKLGIVKRLQAERGPGVVSAVTRLHCASGDEEVRTIVAEIVKIKHDDPEAHFDDIAILVRANNQANVLIEALESAKIPYEFSAAAGLYREPIIIDCFSFLQVLAQSTAPASSAAIYRLLHLPGRELSDTDLHQFLLMAKKKSTPFFEGLGMASLWRLSVSGVSVCEKILTLLQEGMRRSRVEKLTTILYEFLEKSGYFSYLTHEEEIGNQAVIRSIHHLKQFFDYLHQFEASIPGASIVSFVEHYQSVIESGDDGVFAPVSESREAVQIMTVHAAKGLEFRYVFIVNLVEERFPTRERGGGIDVPEVLIKEKLPQGDAHIEEERRLFYVALTRARDRVYLTSADNYGGVRKRKISRFLAEMESERSNNMIEKAIVPGGENTVAVGQRVNNSVESTSKTPTARRLFPLPAAFSFSQVKAYETCPYQYKLAHILKIPTRGSASFSFGMSMHATMQALYTQIKVLNGQEQQSLFGTPERVSVTSNINVPPFEELLQMYDEHWVPDWYLDAKQRDEYYKKGKEILRLFYTSQEGAWTIPVALESWFKIKVGAYVMHGRIDRVDQLPDGSLEIIDYKTGQSKEKLIGDDKDQLLLYQIAAETLPAYHTLGKTSKLTFYYLNDNLRTSFVGASRDLEKLREKLVNTIQSIEAGKFTATPNQFVCQHCDFRDMCEYRQ